MHQRILQDVDIIVPVQHLEIPCPRVDEKCDNAQHQRPHENASWRGRGLVVACRCVHGAECSKTAMKSQRLKKLMRWSVRIILTLVVLLALFILEENLRGRILLAHYKAELRSKGEKLTLEEF